MPRSTAKKKPKPKAKDTDAMKAKAWLEATAQSLSKKAIERMDEAISKQKAKNAVSRMKKHMKKKGIKPKYDAEQMKREREYNDWYMAARDKTS